MADRLYSYDELCEMYPSWGEVLCQWEGDPGECSTNCGALIEPGDWFVPDPDTGGWGHEDCVLEPSEP